MEINFSVKTIEIAGFAATLEALRLPFGKECRSTTKVNIDNSGEFDSCVPFIKYNASCEISPKDLTLMSTLIKRGDEHSKALRGLQVYALIEAPRYFWEEMCTYEVGVTKMGSNSTMHQQCKGMSTEELVATKEALPEGTLQKRMYCFSYQTLRRIWKQRHNHRLPHWHIFCEWIEKLPFANELILTDLIGDKE